MKRIIILLLLSISIAVSLSAQISTKELIADYVEAKMKQQDASKSMMRLQTVYNQKNTKKEKDAFLEDIFNTISEYQSRGRNNESLVLIELYETFADANNKNLPMLFYIKGDIYAEQEDTIGIKDCIKDLQILSTSQANEFITKLNLSIEKIREDSRNYVPVSKRMDGLWVSVNNFVTDSRNTLEGCFTSGEGTPYYVIYAEGSQNENNIHMIGTYGRRSFDKEGSSQVQMVKELKKNIAYMGWSNESLFKPGELTIEYSHRLANLTSEQISSRIFGDSGSSFLGDLGSGLVSSGASQLVKNMLTPSKRIHILEGVIEKLNDNELHGSLLRQDITAKGNNQPTIEKNKDDVVFTKWDDNYGLFYIDEDMKPIVPSMITPVILKSVFKDHYGKEGYKAKSKALEKQHKDEYTKYKKLIKKRTMEKFMSMSWLGLKAFNYLQTMKMYYFNEQKMIKSGLPLDKRLHSNKNHTTLGILLNPSATGKGVCVLSVDDLYPAYLYGVKEGDIILSIDGFELNTPEEVTSFVRTLQPFTMVNLKILRKGKTLELPVELGYQIFIEQ